MKPLIKSFASLLCLTVISNLPLHAQEKAAKDIVDTAIAAGTFKRLFAALTATDLVDMLKGEGPYTVFAPTDDAFSKLGERSVNDLLMPANKALLIDILSNHVVAGEIPLSKAVEVGEVTTLYGSRLKVRFEDGFMKIGRGRTKLIQPDIKTSNGVIHVVDSVLMHTQSLSIWLGSLQYDMKFTKTVALWGSKDIVLVFSDSESDLGKQLDEMVFSKKDFFEASKKEFVFMKVENPRNKHLMNASESEEKTGLWKEYGVDVEGNKITVLLCDKDGVTYATTDYSKGSETEFLTHLYQLRENQSKRD